MQNLVLSVKGMSCGHCVNSIEGALTILGVKNRVDLKNNTVTVEFDENKLTLDRIKEAIEEQGYEV
ncbi:copper chaperone [Paenibacillus anaericanus]|uniref:copper ion binding protein n=1 Tax=Paenibacillus anaericanus TaxID=170367 RepID=UPI0027854368|nr:copper ion binding protein [Paenibacillus anaericanus]MDQ0088999.1 copper chaperone [Paenibacillus anaericanus]